MLTVQSLKSKWMLKKNWWFSLPFPDSATLACVLFLPCHSLFVTRASSPSCPPFIKASWSLCFLAMPLTATKTETDCTPWLSVSVLNLGSVKNCHHRQLKMVYCRWAIGVWSHIYNNKVSSVCIVWLRGFVGTSCGKILFHSSWWSL